MRILSAFLLLFSVVAPHSASADILSFSFTGTVHELNGKAAGEISLGDSVTGTFYYSTDLPDSEASPTYGWYESFGDPLLAGLSFTFGSLTYTTDSDDVMRTIISADPFISSSSMGITALYGATDFFQDGEAVISLNGPSGAFSSDDLVAYFNLVDLSSATVSFSYDGYYVNANLTDITATSVPEPHRGILLVAAVGSLVLRRRRAML
jgi:hypothetical protein